VKQLAVNICRERGRERERERNAITKENVKESLGNQGTFPQA